MPALTQEQARKILARYTPTLTPEQRDDLLSETGAVRTVAGQAVALYDPYAAALADLYDPERVKARTQGSVSETYIDPADVAGYLREQSAAIQLTWPADEAAVSVALDSRMNLKGWGR